MKMPCKPLHADRSLYILNIVRCGFIDVNAEYIVDVSIRNRLKDTLEIYEVVDDGVSVDLVWVLDLHQCSVVTHPMKEGSFWIARTVNNSDDVGVHIAAATKKKWIIY